MNKSKSPVIIAVIGALVTMILIIAVINSNSSKNKTAKSKGIPIISEADFIQSYIEKWKNFWYNNIVR